MKILALLAILLSASAAYAFDSLQISRLSSCGICKDKPNGSEAAISSQTVDRGMRIGVTSSLNCGAMLSDPTIIELSSSATIQVTSVAPAPSHDSCASFMQQEFSIFGLHASTKTIYYVQDGVVLGHISAP
jgi:hypothetical protein